MKVLALLVITLVFSFYGLAQAPKTTLFRIEKLGEEGVLLDKGWKFKAGDNPEWANPEYNDKDWQEIDPTKDIRELPQLWQTNIGWLRLHLSVDSLVRQQSLAMLVQQNGASEIYLNGRLIYQLGQISTNPNEVKAKTLPAGHLIGLPLGNEPIQTIAVRYALQKNIPILESGGRLNTALQIRILEVNKAPNYFIPRDHTSFEFFRAGSFFILAILHLAFYWLQPKQRANLDFFLYALFSALVGSLLNLSQKLFLVETKTYLILFTYVLSILSSIFYLTALYKLFNLRRSIIFWMLSGGLILLFPLIFWLYHQAQLMGFILYTLISLESIRLTIIAIKNKKRGARILAGGALSFFVFFSLFFAIALGYLPSGPYWFIDDIIFSISFLSFPISFSMFLALEFAFTSRSLEIKLEEVNLLSEKTLAQELEKQQILAAQNETLEKQVAERTAEVMAQKEELQSTLETLKSTQVQLIQKEKMASLGELTAGIAHEIQNPLNFINNFSEVSEELISELQQEIDAGNTQEIKAISKDLKQNLTKIHHHGHRADAIVKNMLQHSRASVGEKQLTNINTLTEEYLRLSYHGLRAKDKDFNANLITDFDKSIDKIEVVPQELGRVLLNLFNNAFYATQQKKALLNGQYQPEVKVSTCQQNGRIIIRVYDNGTGIPESVKSKIFQPFFTTKPTGKGTGLGLSLSYDIITKGHGGELKMETKEGEGTSFIISLPKFKI